MSLFYPLDLGYIGESRDIFKPLIQKDLQRNVTIQELIHEVLPNPAYRGLNIRDAKSPYSTRPSRDH